MIESRFGRTDPAEVGRNRAQPGSSPEAEHSEMSKPGAFLRPIQAESLEAALEPAGEMRSPVPLVLEDEHPDTPGLTVRLHAKHDPLLDLVSRLPERADDLDDAIRRRTPQESERDVQVRRAHKPGSGGSGELLLLPANECLDHISRKGERAEEADSLIAHDASRRERA
jgi:hypothetical protein